MSSDHATPRSRAIMASHSAPSLVRLAAIALGVALTMSTTAHAQLDPTTGVVISQGETDPHFALNSNPETNDRLGYSLAAGDFDGDGTLDLVIGAPYEDYDTLSDSGWVHVVYGSTGGLDAVVEDIWDQQDLVGELEAGDRTGFAVAVGNFNGDQYDDLAIGSPGENIGAISDAGCINVVYGSANGLQVNGNQEWDQNSPGVQDGAESGDQLGYSLAAGDLDHDGYDDLAVGVPQEDIGAVSNAGAVLILYGSPITGLTAAGNLSLDRGDAGMGGPQTDDYFGQAVAIGDFNGDTYDDLAVGAPYDSRAATYAGSVHLVYGSQSGLDLTSNVVWTLNNTLGGPAATANDDFGWSLAAGNFDGDLYDDLAIGIPGRTVGGDSDAGAALALYGSGGGIQVGWAWLLQPGVDGLAGSPQADAGFGAALAAGDTDGDGADDLLVSAPYQDVGSEFAAGTIHLVHGAALSGLSATGNVMWDRSQLGVAAPARRTDHFGTSVVLGDFNGDGLADAAGGTPGRTVTSISSAGDVVVVYAGGALFSDGFESGDTTMWSAAVP